MPPSEPPQIRPAFTWDEIDCVLLDMDGTLLDKYFDDYFWEHYVPEIYAAINHLSRTSPAKTALPLPNGRGYPAVDRSRLLVGAVGTRYPRAQMPD